MAKKLQVSVSDYIADNCGELVTYAFQKAIDYCFKNGGGEVIVPAGEYLVGDIRLRSNVTFHLLENAVLKGSRNPADYQNFFNDTLETLPKEQLTGLHWKPIPERKGEHGNDHLNTAGSYWHYAVIRAAFSENIAIIGEAGSQIDGQNCYDPEGEMKFRGPHGIDLHHCKNVRLSGYTVINSGNWAHCIFDTDGLDIKNVTALAGHDGIHIRGCDNVSIEDCILKTGDDSIAGFDNRNVTVKNTLLNSACSAFRFGGTDILIENCTAYGPAEYNFRCALTKEEMISGANESSTARKNMLSFFTYIIDDTRHVRYMPGNIVIRNCSVRNADRFIHLNLSGNEWWQKGNPPEDMLMENIVAEGISMGSNAYGDGEIPFKLTLRNLDFTYREGFEDVTFLKAGEFGSITLDKVKINNYKGSNLIKTWGEKGEVIIQDLECDIEPEKIVVKATEKYECGAI